MSGNCKGGPDSVGRLAAESWSLKRRNHSKPFETVRNLASVVICIMSGDGDGLGTTRRVPL